MALKGGRRRLVRLSARPVLRQAAPAIYCFGLPDSPLVFGADIPWLVQWVVRGGEDPFRRFLLKAISAAFHPGDKESLDVILEARESCPAKGPMKRSQIAQRIGLRFVSLFRAIWLGVAIGLFMVHSPVFMQCPASPSALASGNAR